LLLEYLVIDLETTGLDASRDEIIELAAVRVINGEVRDSFQSFVCPSRLIPAEITMLTGINDDMVADAPELGEVLAELRLFAGDCNHFIAHNISFERSFLEHRLGFVSYWLDTIDLAKILNPFAAGYSLGFLIKDYGLINDAAHRAWGDALVTAQMFVKMREAFKALRTDVWQAFMPLITQVESPLAEFLCEIASELPSLPFKLVNDDNGWEKEACPADYDKEKKEPDDTFRLDLQSLQDSFAPEGIIAGNVKDFERREQQVTMSVAVGEVLNEGGVLMAEAGTGTGKSLAYLLPAAIYAMGSGHPVVISTHTITLQEQLWQKDIPMVQQILGRPFAAVLVKGRSNHLCLRRFIEAKRNVKEHNLAFLLRICVSLAARKDGDDTGMFFNRQEKEKFFALAAHGETCLGYRCPNRRTCFVQKVRRQAEKADLIVINHSLLLSDAILKAESGRGVLPNFEHLIIDEAHNLLGTAEEQLTESFSAELLTRAVYQLYHRERGQSQGRLKLLETMLPLYPNTEKAQELVKELKTKVRRWQKALKEFFNISTDILKAASLTNNQQLRLKPPNRDKIMAKIETPLSNLLFTSQEILCLMEALTEELSDLPQTVFNTEAVDDLRLAWAALSRLVNAGQRICDADLDNYIIWLENYGEGEDQTVWRIVPVEVQPSLQKCIYSAMRTMLLTSATLFNGRDCRYFCRSLGLDEPKWQVKTLQLSSPFDYKKHALMALYTDLPDHNSTPWLVVIEAISEALVSLIRAAGGRTLVLFTSHQQLRDVYNQIVQPLKKEGIRVLAHGISGSRERLLEALRNEPGTCVLGANSFWEGVEVSGEALSLLIAVRLPFLPPGTPIMEARLERISAAGKDAFYSYSLPQAIIRFKQGFGRLIRNNQDSGVFCVLDRRIWEKRYGRYFVEALPEMTMVQGPLPYLSHQVSLWLEHEAVKQETADT